MELRRDHFQDEREGKSSFKEHLNNNTEIYGHLNNTNGVEGYINDKYYKLIKSNILEELKQSCDNYMLPKIANNKFVNYVEVEGDFLRQELNSKNRIIELLLSDNYVQHNKIKDSCNVMNNIDLDYSPGISSKQTYNSTESKYRTENTFNGVMCDQNKCSESFHTHTGVNLTYVFELFDDSWKPVKYSTNFQPGNLQAGNDGIINRSKTHSTVDYRHSIDYKMYDCGASMTLDDTLLNDFKCCDMKQSCSDWDRLSTTNECARNCMHSGGGGRIEKIAEKLMELTTSIKEKKILISTIVPPNHQLRGDFLLYQNLNMLLLSRFVSVFVVMAMVLLINSLLL